MVRSGYTRKFTLLEVTVSGPELNGIKFKPCCERALRDIKDVQELGRVLSGLVAASPFLIVFGSNPVDTAVSLKSTDWDIWQQAVSSVPTIIRYKCQQLSAFELLNHSGGDLGKFWRELYDSFG